MTRIAILGAGGFAREVRWLIEEINRAAPRYAFAGYLVSDPSTLGPYDSADEVVGALDVLEDEDRRPDALAIGIGNPTVRYRLGTELQAQYPTIAWPALVHPTVRYDAASCRLGAGALLCSGVILTVNVVVEPFALLNLACTVGHEAHIGSGAVLNPTVNISGGVTLGDRVAVGTGTQILQYLEVGADTVIGAGAVVTKDLPANVTAVGVPAKVITST